MAQERSREARCSICSASREREIELARVCGVSLRDIAEPFGGRLLDRRNLRRGTTSPTLIARSISPTST